MQPVSLTLRQGVDAGIVWPVTNTDGTPADLTDWVPLSSVRQFEAPDAPLLATLDAFIDMSDETVTYVGVRWTAAESLDWGWLTGNADLLLVDPNGDSKQFIWQGLVKVDRAVTVNG